MHQQVKYFSVNQQLVFYGGQKVDQQPSSGIVALKTAHTTVISVGKPMLGVNHLARQPLSGCFPWEQNSVFPSASTVPFASTGMIWVGAMFTLVTTSSCATFVSVKPTVLQGWVFHGSGGTHNLIFRSTFLVALKMPSQHLPSGAAPQLPWWNIMFKNGEWVNDGL